MTFRTLIDKKTLASIHTLSEKSQQIVMEKLKTLQEDPYPGAGGSGTRSNSDKERLYVHGREDTCRLHISRTFTAFYRIHEPEKEVYILAVMSIDQAHKRYGWF